MRAKQRELVTSHTTFGFARAGVPEHDCEVGTHVHNDAALLGLYLQALPMRLLGRLPVAEMC